MLTRSICPAVLGKLLGLKLVGEKIEEKQSVNYRYHVCGGLVRPLRVDGDLHAE